jgi:outer membrane protein
MKIATLIITILFANLAQAYNLEDALMSGYRNNPQILSERKSLEAVAEKYMQAFAGFMPQINGSISANNTKATTTMRDKTAYNAVNSQIAVEQNIFNGGKTTNAMKQATAQFELAKAKLHLVEQKLFTDIINSYTSLLIAEESFNTSINNEKLLLENYDSTSLKFKLGEATITDVAQAQSRLAQAVATKIKLENDLYNAKAKFKVIVGAEGDNLELIKQARDLPQNLEQTLSIANKDNFNILMANYSKKIADLDVKISKGSLSPSVSLSGQLNKSHYSQSPTTIATIDSSAIAMITVTVPIYQGGADHSRIRESKINRAKSKYLTNDTHNSVILEATTSWNNYQVSGAALQASKEAVKALEVAYNGVYEESKVGMRTNLDLLNAEQELFNAKLNLITIENQQIAAGYFLKAAIGKLTAKHLKLPVNYYEADKQFKQTKSKIIGF